jgi:hypothetical protein
VEQAFEDLAGPWCNMEQQKSWMAWNNAKFIWMRLRGGELVRCKCAGGLGVALRAIRSPGNGYRKRRDGDEGIAGGSLIGNLLSTLRGGTSGRTRLPFLGGEESKKASSNLMGEVLR